MQCLQKQRAHRLGQFNKGATRGIIVNFLDYQSPVYILPHANLLRSTSFSINKDFPKETTQARKTLWPRFKQIRDSNPRSKVTMILPAKIVMDGKVIEDACPDWNTLLHGNRAQVSSSAYSNRNPHAQQALNTRCKEDRPSSNSSAPNTLASNTGIIHKVVDPPPVSSANHVPRRSQSVSPNPPRTVHTRSHAPISPRTPFNSQTPAGSIQRPWDTQSNKDAQSGNKSSLPPNNATITNEANSHSR
ncbi:hypothetical protein DPMN_082639 [Dreissena polymorpha]|uniref:Uncharacterized protein n=1 Tax=Dreissena polymorpha TaxID=45954 RepID=A0A9D4BJ12_DREPO|nr:hypothetical protein DPMN_082639 [Dreissena polymorpha]